MLAAMVLQARNFKKNFAKVIEWTGETQFRSMDVTEISYHIWSGHHARTVYVPHR